jgi:hypothetical protein
MVGVGVCKTAGCYSLSASKAAFTHLQILVNSPSPIRRLTYSPLSIQDEAADAQRENNVTSL